MRSLPRLAVLTVAAAALVLGSGTSAFAQSTTVKDKTNDIVRFDGKKLTTKQKKVGRDVDVKAASVKHTSGSLRIKLTFTKLGAFQDGQFQVRTNGSATPTHVVHTYSDGTGFIKTDVYTANPDGALVECATTSKMKKGKNGYVSIVVPRACLGSPEKLRVSGTVGRQYNQKIFLLDHISKSKKGSASYTPWLARA